MGSRMIRAAQLGHAATAWLDGLGDRIGAFLQTLRADEGNPAKYLPCPAGATETGRRVSLGNCCFAAKTLFTIGYWQQADPRFRQSHIDWIRQFQTDPRSGRGFQRGAFVDPAVHRALQNNDSWRRRWKRLLFARGELTPRERLYLAETKQAWATLRQVGAAPQSDYEGVPTSERSLRYLLSRFRWNAPWAAGGQFSCASTLLALRRRTTPAEGECWRRVLIEETDRIVDPLSGGYFAGPRPDHGQLVNGAMKVLTALAWLDHPIHYPERLVDTCLRQLPESSGCHLVDAVYVLHQCRQQVAYRRHECAEYARRVLDQLRSHHCPDGGFSYRVGQSQTSYYGARIAKGLAEGDLHATCLMSWAIALCEKLVDQSLLNWNVMKP